MPNPPAALYLRPDYPAKSGGDLVLAREYESALRRAGADAELHPVDAASLRSGSGPAVLFNVDRYFEFVAAARARAAAGRPYVVAPVHHPTAFVDRFERERRPSPLKAIATVGGTAFGRERIKHVLRGRSPRALRESAVRDVRGAVRQALAAAAAVVVQAPAETAQLAETFGADVAAKTTWVPNGVTVDAAVPTDGVRDIDLLVAGRIEERKNPLRIAQAFGGTATQVLFVGGDNHRNAAYAAEFHALVAQHDNLRHLPHVPLDELRRLYARSKVFFSASRFEVVSLAELESVAYGCRLVSTTSGYMRDYLGDGASYLDPGADDATMRAAADTAVAAGVDMDGLALVRERYTWDRNHEALAGAFRAASLL